MWGLIVIIAISCFHGYVPSQLTDKDDVILEFLGTSDPETVDPEEAERLSSYLSRPLPLNLVSLNRLRSSGLLTPYQAASLHDYRSRHGAVLSLTELASVDGFGEDFVSLLSPFISLYDDAAPGSRPLDGKSVNVDIASRSGIRKDSGTDLPLWNYGFKARVSAWDGFSASFSASRPYASSGWKPDTFSGYLRWEFRKMPAQVVLGDFNARFGQGLALWNGMSMSGVSSVSAISKSPAGISQSWSYTGSTSYTGIAADLTFGKFTLSALASLPGIKNTDSYAARPSLMPAVNLAWNNMNGHYSITHWLTLSGTSELFPDSIPDMKTSMDFSSCLDGIDLFGELAYDWVNSVPAAIAGVRLPVNDNLKMASVIRYYPPDYSPSGSGSLKTGTETTNEYAVTFLGEFSAGERLRLKGRTGFGSEVNRHTGRFSIDAAYFPVPKSDASMSMQIRPFVDYEVLLSDQLCLNVRISERIRTWGRKFRTDIRTEFSWLHGNFSLNTRLNALKCNGLGLLTYVEGHYKDSSKAFSLRQGLFMIDEWDDRIYVYERDAPGSFTVPAMYGRGLWTSVTFSVRFARKFRLYLRGYLTTYPLMDKENKKPGKAELKVQLQYSL